MSATSRAGRATNRRLLRRRPLGVSPGRLAARRAQARDRALDLGDEFLSPRGCSEPSCRAFRVRATPESAECPCRPRADGLRRNDAANEARPPCAAPPPSPPLEQPAELARSRRVTINATGKQPTLFRRNAGVAPGRPRLPPSPQQVEDLGRKHHITVLAAFRLHDADDHLLAVDVAGSQPHHFAGPQPATIRERQHRVP